MDKKGFNLHGNWYKGNLHSHSTISDGIKTPKELTELYSDGGFHFICISDHDIYTDFRETLDSTDFITLPGIEYSAILYDGQSPNLRLKVHHLHGILGIDEMKPERKLEHLEMIQPMKFYGQWDGARVCQEMADMLKSYGFITTYNHPIWSRVEPHEFIHTKGLDLYEIFNYNTVLESSTGYDVVYWDTILRLGGKINGFASDDNHNEGVFDDSLGGWIAVNAKELTHKEIVHNIMLGNYYSSSGPEIYDFGIKNSQVFVKCSPVNRVNFVGGNIINDGTTILGEHLEDSITEASYSLKGHESYIRVECVDKFGRTGWTNPIYLSQI